MLHQVVFVVDVPGQRFPLKDISPKDDLILVIVIIILEVSEIEINSCGPVVVGLRLVCWITLQLEGTIKLVILGWIWSSWWLRWYKLW
jgi:hypothetical protein